MNRRTCRVAAGPSRLAKEIPHTESAESTEFVLRDGQTLLTLLTLCDIESGKRTSVSPADAVILSHPRLRRPCGDESYAHRNCHFEGDAAPACLPPRTSAPTEKSTLGPLVIFRRAEDSRDLFHSGRRALGPFQLHHRLCADRRISMLGAQSFRLRRFRRERPLPFPIEILQSAPRFWRGQTVFARRLLQNDSDLPDAAFLRILYEHETCL
jgi:hypothetical protein